MKILFSYILLLFCCSLFAVEPGNQTSVTEKIVIEGKVVDEISGEELPGVEVKLLDSGLVIYTDFEGNFVFTDLEPRKYTLSATYVSYKKRIITNIIPASGSEKYTIKLKGVENQSSVNQSGFSSAA